jgi:hypothetical protein
VWQPLLYFELQPKTILGLQSSSTRDDAVSVTHLEPIA